MVTAYFEPNVITAGDFVEWKKTLADYPASDWSLSYVLINSVNKISISASADGSDHYVSVTPSVSANWAAGVYKMQGYVTKGAQRFTVVDVEITIKANFATATTLDTRSHVKKVLDALEALIEGKATADQQEYTIAGRSLKRMPVSDLIMWREKYRVELLREQNAERMAKGLGTKNKILMRF